MSLVLFDKIFIMSSEILKCFISKCNYVIDSFMRKKKYSNEMNQHVFPNNFAWVNQVISQHAMSNILATCSLKSQKKENI